MMHLSVPAAVVTLAVLVGTAVGETHTVVLINECPFGTPYLIKGQDILSDGPYYVSDGPLTSTIAYLQTDDNRCGFNGENCTLLQTALINLAPGNAGSLTDISLIPPHEFSVPTGFRYFGGCDGEGADCRGPECHAAKAPVSCQVDNVGLAIIFCGGDF